MKFAVNYHVVIAFLLLISTETLGGNLTCYQCIRNSNTECAPEELLPCPSVSDRCVTHISRDAEKGFSIKRECGLGPCGFDDVMATKGLGLDRCDRSRPEYFCIFCCRDSGCNKSKANFHHQPMISAIVTCITIIATISYY